MKSHETLFLNELKRCGGTNVNFLGKSVKSGRIMKSMKVHFDIYIVVRVLSIGEI